MARYQNPVPQYLDDAGNPVPLGKLFFKESGSDLDKDTFADVNLSIPNTNPVLLSASGRTPNIFFNGTAKLIFTDSDSVQIFERDPVEAGAGGSGNFSSYNNLTIYSSGVIVTGDDGLYYVSLTDGNQGNEPSASPADWTQVLFTRVYNALETYVIGQIVRASDNLLYVSNTNANLGNDPTTDSINWSPATTIDVPAVVLAAGKTFANQNF